MFAWNLDLGVDLGSSFTTVWERGAGIVLQEPSLIAYATAAKDRRPIAVGEEAKEVRDRAVSEARVLQPVVGGVVADHEAAAAMLRRRRRSEVCPDAPARKRPAVRVRASS